MKNMVSPQEYIDMSFYAMISAALQRRVWLGSTEMPLFPNMYVILIGPPGIGKGLAIKPVSNFLRFHQRFNPNQDEQVEEESMQESLAKRQRFNLDNALFRSGADSTTFQALVSEMAGSIRNFRLTQPMEFAPSCNYKHTSMYITLEEMGSLFRTHQEDLLRFLQAAWDCGEFRYTVIGRGTDYIKNCCLTILAAAQPTFLQDSMNNKVVGEGFSSRAIFVSCSRSRFNSFGISKFTEEQISESRIILEHLKNLGNLFGEVSLTSEAYNYLDDYFKNKHQAVVDAAHKSLLHYHARKASHVQKLAMAMHFGETSSIMNIELETVVKAMTVLDKLELTMADSLNIKTEKTIKYERVNKVSDNYNMVLQYITNSENGVKFANIWNRFIDTLDERDCNDCIKFLVMNKKIEVRDGNYFALT